MISNSDKHPGKKQPTIRPEPDEEIYPLCLAVIAVVVEKVVQTLGKYSSSAFVAAPHFVCSREVEMVVMACYTESSKELARNLMIGRLPALGHTAEQGC
jgi:hypothetical protein